MKLEIIDAIDKGEKIVLEMEYDEEFADTIAKVFGVKTISDEQIEDFVTMVLENLDPQDLELGDKIDE